MFAHHEIDYAPDEVLVYLRKSRSDDPRLTVEEVLERHEGLLDAWAENKLGAKVPEENKFREVVSGETIKDRPEIQKVLKLMESPKYRAVLIVEIQRLSRGDLEDAGRLIKLLRYTNTTVITTNDGVTERIYDLRDEMEREYFERELKRGNEFLEYQKKIMNRGREISVSLGNYVGSHAPYGFDKITVMDGKRKCPTLKENKEQADAVRMIFDLYVNKNMGYVSIARHLDSLGVPPPTGKRWSPETLPDMLRNIHYIGKIKWNWRKTVQVVEDGEVKKKNPRTEFGEYLVFEGRHDGIVPEDLFYAAVDKMGKNPRKKAASQLRNPFAGLLYCQCGRAMILKYYKNKDGSQRSAPRLLCDETLDCNNGSCQYTEILERVIEILKQCIEDFEVRIENDTGDAVLLHARLIKNLEKKLETLKARELEQWKAQSDPDESMRMPPEIFKQLNAELLKEKEEINDALCKARESMPEPVNYRERVASFREALEALQDPDVDAEQKNNLLKNCIERIDYKREKPQRTNGSAKLVTVDGRKVRTDGKKIGTNWTSPPIELNVRLKV